MKKDCLNKFSVPLGLLDYINPVLYSITMILVMKNIYPFMDKPFNYILLAGAVLSIVVGLIIPTGKVIVGLGIIEFVMPVSLVFCVNFGIFWTGLMLLNYVLKLSLVLLIVIVIVSIILLGAIYNKKKKINTVAVLTGAIGYLMIYVSLIILSLTKAVYFPVILYGLAICLFIMLCGIGIKANLKDPKVHWVIEASNVTCQLFVTIATYLLFK